MKKKLLITIPHGDVRDTFVPDSVLQYARTYFEVNCNETDSQLSVEQLREQLCGFDAVLTGWGNALLDRNVIENNSRLKLIIHTGGTVGNLVDSYVYDRQISVLSGNFMYAESVAEGTLAYMLTALRRIPDYIYRVRAGKWRTEADLWEGLIDKTIGIVGFGTISSILIKLLQPFRVKIKIYSHYDIDTSFLTDNNCKCAGLDEIFSECDIVSLHSALNSENRGLITKHHFEMMKHGSLFINTARGGVIDEAALIEELKKNRFRAVLDVYQSEPIADDSELRALPNVYCIPHMAGPTLDRRPIITKALIDEAQRFFNGEKNLKLEISRELATRMTKM